MMKTNQLRRDGAFTLIELLIVTALIAVLAALAVVNFGESQTRAKVARVKADMRTIAGALQAYCVDRGAYPAAADGDFILVRPLQVLTSPQAYLTSVPTDPFGIAPFRNMPTITMRGYNYKDAGSTSLGLPGETYGPIWKGMPDKKYMIHSCGPNQVWDVMPYVGYDPTNGTRSEGDICELGP